MRVPDRDSISNFLKIVKPGQNKTRLPPSESGFVKPFCLGQGNHSPYRLKCSQKGV